MLIDGGDISWVPREVAETDPVVWKVMFAGSWRDLRFVHRLSNLGGTLESFISTKHGWLSRRGFQVPGTINEPDILNKPFVAANHIRRYWIGSLASRSPWHTNGFKRTGDVNVYLAPHVLVKEGTKGGRLTAAFVPESCTFKDTITGIHAPSGNERYLKAIAAYLNSSLAAYFLFMTTGWGIDRMRVKKGEVLSLPALPITDDGVVSELSALFDSIVEQHSPASARVVEGQIEGVIARVFKLTKSERTLIKDMSATSIDYVHQNVKSKSIEAPTKKNVGGLRSRVPLRLRSYA